MAEAAAQNKKYDGTTVATITGILEGVIEGDDVSIRTGIFASKDAGNRAVSNVTLKGTQAANYKLELDQQAEFWQRSLQLNIEVFLP